MSDPASFAGIFTSVESRKNAFFSTASQCAQAGITFCPLVLEAVGGGWSDPLRSVVAGTGSESKWSAPVSGSDASFKIVQRLSCTFHRENARAILKRAPEQTGSRCRSLGLSLLADSEHVVPGPVSSGEGLLPSNEGFNPRWHSRGICDRGLEPCPVGERSSQCLPLRPRRVLLRRLWMPSLPSLSRKISVFFVLRCWVPRCWRNFGSVRVWGCLGWCPPVAPKVSDRLISAQFLVRCLGCSAGNALEGTATCLIFPSLVRLRILLIRLSLLSPAMFCLIGKRPRTKTSGFWGYAPVVRQVGWGLGWTRVPEELF